MLLCTTDLIPNKNYEILGLVKGAIVQSKNAGKDFFANMKSFVGGEIKSYTDMIAKARQKSTDRMIEEAENMGADAIVCVRYVSSAVTQGASEVLAYGTAVKFV